MFLQGLPFQVVYVNGRATITAGDVTIEMYISKQQLKQMYNWGKGGKKGRGTIDIFIPDKLAPELEEPVSEPSVSKPVPMVDEKYDVDPKDAEIAEQPKLKEQDRVEMIRTWQDYDRQGGAG